MQKQNLATSCALLAVLACVLLTQAAAQTTGVTPDEIRIGSCAAVDGPARQLGIQTILGATAYFNYINARGGVNGRKLRLIAMDDGYDPTHAAACYAKLKGEGIFAAGFFVGTPTAAKYVPMAEADKLPIVGWFTGAPILYEPMKRYILPVRASYADETREQVDGLWNAGVRKIAVIYQNDAFGEAVLSGVKAALAKHNSSPIALGTFARNTLEVDEGIKTTSKARPEAVILAGPYAPIAKIVKDSHAQGWRPTFVTVSFVGTEALINAAGNDADGVVITQVVPPYDRLDLPTVGLYRNVLAQYMSSASPSFVSFEAFVDAMVMVEGLKRAGSDLKREKFIDSIESLKDFELGLGPQMKLHYKSTDHRGFTSVYPTVIRNGKPVVFSDWKEVR